MQVAVLWVSPILEHVAHTYPRHDAKLRKFHKRRKTMDIFKVCSRLGQAAFCYCIIYLFIIDPSKDHKLKTSLEGGLVAPIYLVHSKSVPLFGFRSHNFSHSRRCCHLVQGISTSGQERRLFLHEIFWYLRTVWIAVGFLKFFVQSFFSFVTTFIFTYDDVWDRLVVVHSRNWRLVK